MIPIQEMSPAPEEGAGDEVCAKSDTRVLEPDHVRGKNFSISKAIRHRKWSAILAELSLCDIVCANDHRRREYARRGSYHEGVV